MKRIAIILFLAFALTLSAHAQIFLEDGEYNENRALSEDLGIVPYHGVTHDQADFVPIGCGITLFTVLGGAYLLTKKKSNNNK